MPIYEFYCSKCNTIFSFFSRTVNTDTCPSCPKCVKNKLTRQVSLFAATGRAKEGANDEDFQIDESKMEQAMGMLANEAENINEDDPRQAAKLMRKFSDTTGLQFGESMEEALGRLESGEDPDTIEQEMGDLLNADEEPFVLPDSKASRAKHKPAPRRDDTLYEM